MKSTNCGSAVEIGGRARRRAARGVLALVAAGGAMAVASPAVADNGAWAQTDVQCDANHNGVVDVTMINNGLAEAALFQVRGGAEVSVAPQSSHAVSFTGLADGDLALPIVINGRDASVVVTVQCDPAVFEVAAPPLPASQSNVPVVNNSTKSSSSKVNASVASLPATGAETTWGLLAGTVLAGAGICATLLSRRRA